MSLFAIWTATIRNKVGSTTQYTAEHYAVAYLILLPEHILPGHW